MAFLPFKREMIFSVRPGITSASPGHATGEVMAHGFLFYASRTTPAQPEEQNLFRRAEPGSSGDAAGAAAGHPYLRGAAKGSEVQGVDSRYPSPRHLHFKPRGCAFLGFSIFMAAIFQHDEPCHDTNNFCFNPAA